MTATQIINMPNPLSKLNKYASAYLCTHEEMERIIIPVNPNKQKFYGAWNKVLNKITNNSELYYLYDEKEINNSVDKIKEWTITKMKNYVGAYIRKYSNNGWRVLLDKEAKREHKLIYIICRDFLNDYYPEICAVSEAGSRHGFFLDLEDLAN